MGLAVMVAFCGVSPHVSPVAAASPFNITGVSALQFLYQRSTADITRDTCRSHHAVIDESLLNTELNGLRSEPFPFFCVTISFDSSNVVQVQRIHTRVPNFSGVAPPRLSRPLPSDPNKVAFCFSGHSRTFPLLR